MPEPDRTVSPVVGPDRQEIEECLRRAHAQRSALAAASAALGPPRRHTIVAAPARLFPVSVRDDAAGALLYTASLDVDDLDETP